MSNTKIIASFSAMPSRNIIPVRICRSVRATSVTNSCDPSQTLIVGSFGCSLLGTEPIWLVGCGAAVVTDFSHPPTNSVPTTAQPMVHEAFIGSRMRRSHACFNHLLNGNRPFSGVLATRQRSSRRREEAENRQIGRAHV